MSTSQRRQRQKHKPSWIRRHRDGGKELQPWPSSQKIKKTKQRLKIKKDRTAHDFCSSRRSTTKPAQTDNPIDVLKEAQGYCSRNGWFKCIRYDGKINEHTKKQGKAVSQHQRRKRGQIIRAATQTADIEGTQHQDTKPKGERKSKKKRKTIAKHGRSKDEARLQGTVNSTWRWVG